ncbi:Colicin V production protein [Candidatus Hartigia pinicola]|nr:Colicin V production protein [Candidatus Hartigia pinicola]
MIWVDYVIIVIISISALLSLIRGFVRETLSLIVWGCAFFISSKSYHSVAKYFAYFDDIHVRNGITIAVLFIATLIVGAIFNSAISSLVQKTSLSGIDRILGVCFGVLRGACIISVLLFFLDILTTLSKNEDWKHSILIPKFSCIIKWFFTTYKIVKCSTS